MIKRLAGALGLIVLAIAAQGQQHANASPPSSAKTGSVDGRVFGITQSGDLKPARMPKLWLLFQGLGEHHCVNDVCESTADRQYQLTSLDAVQKRLDAKRRDLDNQLVGDENLECRASLLDTDRTLLDVTQWALDNKKAKQVLTTDGDEEGRFTITKVPIGHYRIVARGQAGASDAYWELWITVKPGTASSVKLMKPGKSCINVE